MIGTKMSSPLKTENGFTLYFFLLAKKKSADAPNLSRSALNLSGNNNKEFIAPKRGWL